MTVTEAIKKLQKIAEESPRAQLFAESDSFLSDDYTHGLVNSIRAEYLPMTDDYGCTKENKDGSQHERYSVVLSGK